jgi:hypothetical protein
VTGGGDKLCDTGALLLLAWLKAETGGLASFKVKNCKASSEVIGKLAKQIALPMLEDI